MKIFLEWLKDFLYDSIDYVIMVVIIISVVFVIGWRLDVLFANDALDIPNDNVVIVQDPQDDLNKDPGHTQEPDDVETPKDVVVEPPKDNTTVPPVEGKSTILIIPPGSLTSKIGSLLESNGLVTSKNDFVSKAQELKLDTKLKSGTFTIPDNSSIEDVLNIITK